MINKSVLHDKLNDLRSWAIEWQGRTKSHDWYDGYIKAVDEIQEFINKQETSDDSR